MLTVEGKTAGTLQRRAFSSQFITMNTSSDRFGSVLSYLVVFTRFSSINYSGKLATGESVQIFSQSLAQYPTAKRPSIECLPFNVFPFSVCGKFEACGSTKAVAAEALEPRL